MVAPHSFWIQDEDLFKSPMATDLRALRCGQCGLQPGQGVHAPPPPPFSRVLVDEVAKTIAATYDRDWKGCLTEASRAAFKTVQLLRSDLGSLVDKEIDGEIDELLTELRMLGWGDQQGT